MKLYRIWRDVRGATAVEFGLTAPAFFLVLFALVNGGMLVWTQMALQHGVEMAARCASVDKTLCGSDTGTKAYAAKQVPGLSPPTSVFVVTPTTESEGRCGTRVEANYPFNLFTSYLGTAPVQLSAQSWFPKPCNS